MLRRPHITRGFLHTAVTFGALGFVASSCGSGLAGIVSSSSSSGSSSNAPPSISAFTVVQSRVTPATLRFRTIDAEGDPVAVEIFFQRSGEAPESITQLAGRPNPDSYASSGAGVDHVVEWNFTSEPALADVSDGSFAGEVTVFATLLGGIQEAVPGASDISGLGNDAPTITVDSTDDEVTGIVAQGFRVADSSSDSVRIRAEYDIVGDDPDLGWLLARPGGLPESAPTPAFAFEGIEAPATGVELVFFWDTDADLEDLDRDVRLRFTAIDSVTEGLAAVTNAFRVDNNDPPTVSIQGDQFVLNPDQLGGIPIPFTVRDAESDDVRVVFQWRRAGEDFPDLPETRSGIEEMLRDPFMRRELRICSEIPSAFRGTLVPGDDTHVRLIELASTASTLLVQGLAGRRLRILRPPAQVERISDSWNSDAVAGPVAALPVGDGLTALFLDQPQVGSWRLSEIVLSTGDVRERLADNRRGAPSAMARDDLGPLEAVLVATHFGDTWSVERVTLGGAGRPSQIQELVTADASTELGPIRGLVSLGRGVCLATVGSSIVRLDYRDPAAPQQVTLFDGLETPWGIVRDPVRPDRIYVAESEGVTPDGLGRLLQIDLNTRSVQPLRPTSPVLAGPLLPRPRALSIERGGTRLVAVCEVEASLSPFEVRGIDLEPGTPVFSIHEGLASAPSVASGGPSSRRLRLLALPASNEVYAIGGIEQERTIEEVDVSTSTVQTEPFSPALRRDRAWCVQDSTSVRAQPEGVARTFTWDSQDARQGRVFIRASVVDTEVGFAEEIQTSKEVRDLIAPAGTVVDASNLRNVEDALFADLDQDGDLDIAATSLETNNLALFFREDSGAFSETALVLGNELQTNAPRTLAAADLDLDGDVDLVSANRMGDNLTIFYQQAPGAFDRTPTTLGSFPTVNAPWDVQVGDLNQDGLPDIASTNSRSNNLTVFLQSPSGEFDSPPVVLSWPGVTLQPRRLAIADLDGDRDLDIVCTNQQSQTLAVFSQVEPGEFAGTQVLGKGIPFGTLRSVIVIDLDGDGARDIVAADRASTAIRVFYQTSTGSFAEPPAVIEDNPFLGSPSEVVARDVDGDGLVDLLCSRSGSTLGSGLALVRQTAKRVFEVFPVPTGSVTAQGIDVVGPDTNGTIEIVTTGGIANSLNLYRSREIGDFSTTPTRLLDSLSLFQPRVTAGDLDQDGDLDVAVAVSAFPTIRLFFQESPRIFSAMATGVPLGGGFTPYATEWITLADVDLDGDLDIVGSDGFTQGRVTVVWQTAPGQFGGNVVSLGSLFDPRQTRVVDIDGDNDLDILVADDALRVVALYLQKESGVFETTPRIIGSSFVLLDCDSIAVEDLNNDGRLDVVVADRSSQVAVFYQGQGLSFPEEPVRLGADTGDSLFSKWLDTEDLDQDGDIDIVATTSSNGFTVDTVAIHIQTEPGVFADPILLEGEPLSQVPIVAADIDRDDDIDIVIGGRLSAYIQVRPGVFTAQPVRYSESLGAGVGVIDLDQDGNADLLHADQSINLPMIYWGGDD